MIATTHKEVFRIADLPRKQGHDNLHWKAASVYEVSVEQVRVLFRRYAIELENIQQIVVLPMNVAAHRDLLIVGACDIYQRLVLLEQLTGLHYDHASILLVQYFPIFLPLHDGLNPIGSDIFYFF